MRCENKQCNKEFDKGGWFFMFADNKVPACSIDCYMYLRLFYEHPRLADFKIELKLHHPRWIATMKPFLDGMEMDEPIPLKITWWRKLLK